MSWLMEVVRWLLKYRPWWRREETVIPESLAQAEARRAVNLARIQMLEHQRDLILGRVEGA